jgi:hypothetical protein
MTGCNVRTWLAASMLLLCDVTSAPSDGRPVRPPLVWATYVPDLTVPYTASTFTPNEDIEVTRVQAQLESPGQTCRVNPAITVSNGTARVTLSLTTLANDTGPVSTSFVAGIPITLSVSSLAACLLAPSWANVVVQYASRPLVSASWP